MRAAIGNKVVFFFFPHADFGTGKKARSSRSGVSKPENNDEKMAIAQCVLFNVVASSVWADIRQLSEKPSPDKSEQLSYLPLLKVTDGSGARWGGTGVIYGLKAAKNLFNWHMTQPDEYSWFLTAKRYGSCRL